MTSSRPSAGARAANDGQSDLLLESSFYNLYQSSCYPAYYGNLYNYQQYQVRSTDPLTVHRSSFLNHRSEIGAETVDSGYSDVTNLCVKEVAAHVRCKTRSVEAN